MVLRFVVGPGSFMVSLQLIDLEHKHRVLVMGMAKGGSAQAI